jgi:hypothetical protein
MLISNYKILHARPKGFVQESYVQKAQKVPDSVWAKGRALPVLVIGLTWSGRRTIIPGKAISRQLLGQFEFGVFKAAIHGN